MTAEPPPFRYFAYGSNLSEARLHENCPSARLEAVARLPGYRLAFTRRSERWGGGVADIRPNADAGAAVWGIVWRIAAAEGDALDRQEGVHISPPRYRRIDVTVRTTSGGAVDCLAYQVVEPEAGHIAPAAAYLDTMLRGARAAGLPRGYIARLDAIASGKGQGRLDGGERII